MTSQQTTYKTQTRTSLKFGHGGHICKNVWASSRRCQCWCLGHEQWRLEWVCASMSVRIISMFTLLSTFVSAWGSVSMPQGNCIRPSRCQYSMSRPSRCRCGSHLQYRSHFPRQYQTPCLYQFQTQVLVSVCVNVDLYYCVNFKNKSVSHWVFRCNVEMPVPHLHISYR